MDAHLGGFSTSVSGAAPRQASWAGWAGAVGWAVENRLAEIVLGWSEVVQVLNC